MLRCDTHCDCMNSYAASHNGWVCRLRSWSDWNIGEWIWTQAVRFASDCEKRVFCNWTSYTILLSFFIFLIFNLNLYLEINIWDLSIGVHLNVLRCIFLHNHLVMIHISHMAIFMLIKDLNIIILETYPCIYRSPWIYFIPLVSMNWNYNTSQIHGDIYP